MICCWRSLCISSLFPCLVILPLEAHEACMLLDSDWVISSVEPCFKLSWRNAFAMFFERVKHFNSAWGLGRTPKDFLGLHFPSYGRTFTVFVLDQGSVSHYLHFSMLLCTYPVMLMLCWLSLYWFHILLHWAPPFWFLNFLHFCAHTSFLAGHTLAPQLN